MAIHPADSLPILSAGRHGDPREGACLMEYVSVLAGEKFSDHPRCTDRLLAHLARMVNDASTASARSALARQAPELIGTADADTPTRDALVEGCFRVAGNHGAARLKRSRIPILAWSRIAHLRGVEHTVKALRRLPGDAERDAALYDLLAAAATACHRPHLSRDEEPALGQRDNVQR